ncbi:phosphate transporter family domain-containing protein [Ditylenchus destructor]|uniref:Phosphate transporter n=1 Tax=Ditylenchus destructor TaxID=166010 RepID=A0AAD4NDW7_9BILA|nr:phosphate transporter family domain-containing protein [Ditylenchus destructor]
MNFDITTTLNPDLPSFQHEYLWAVIVGAVLALLLGLGMGANDVSNAFGTSVGSKVLTMKQAYILATIFEVLGAVLIGFSVTDTMRKHVVDINLYKEEPEVLLAGQVSILGGSSLYLILATICKLPVSSTQSVVGATVGFSLLTKGMAGIEWMEILQIVVSWFVSPILSALVSSSIYLMVDFAVLRRKDPINCGLMILPFVYFICVVLNLLSATFHGSELLKLSNIPLWVCLVISIGVGLFTALIVEFLVKPRLIRWINYSDSDSFTGIYIKSSGQGSMISWNVHNQELDAKDINSTSIFRKAAKKMLQFFHWFLPDRARKDDEKTLKLFSLVQVVTACFAVVSWFVSPILSALVSSSIYLMVDFAVLRRKDPINCGLMILPFVYFICVVLNLLSATFHGSELLKLSNIPLWVCLVISIGVGLFTALIVEFLVKPRLIRWINYSDSDSFTGIYIKSSGQGSMISWNVHNQELDAKDINSTSIFRKAAKKMLQFFHWFLPDRARKDDEKTLKLFSLVQVVTACFAGFAHGSNDISNTIAPLTALWSIYREEDVSQNQPTPIYVLLFGVSAIYLGLWLFGHRVISTVGQKMATIHPASGFSIEFGCAVTVLLASKIGIPVSTTHCLIGSIVAVGVLNSYEGVNWLIFRNIVLSWLVTLPASGLFAAGITYMLV